MAYTSKDYYYAVHKRLGVLLEKVVYNQRSRPEIDPETYAIEVEIGGLQEALDRLWTEYAQEVASKIAPDDFDGD